MKAILLALFTVSLVGTTFSQSDNSHSYKSNGPIQYYSSACPGDSLRVMVYSTSGALLSTIVIPDDAQLAIFADSSRNYTDLTEFRGRVSIRSISCKDRTPEPGRNLKDVFASAPMQFSLDQGFVVVYKED
jgi:hypothetical protein